jgi:hypothetical protein
VKTDGHHHRSPRRYVDDRNRDLQWERCGVPVVRLAVEDLQDGDALVNRLREEICGTSAALAETASLGCRSSCAERVIAYSNSIKVQSHRARR